MSRRAHGADTHRLRVFAVVSGAVLGQSLLLLVQRPRLQDHLLQLEGGVAVQTTFLRGGVMINYTRSITNCTAVNTRWPTSH